MQQTPWLSRVSLSSLADAADAFLARAGFDRGPWMAVALAAGIAAWFVLPDAAGWVASIALGLLAALGALALWKGREDRAHLVIALVTLRAGVRFWHRADLGTLGSGGDAAFERPLSGMIEGRVLERIEQPAEGADAAGAGHPQSGRWRAGAGAGQRAAGAGRLRPCARARWCALQARLMPPSPPMLPGGYNFARTAWFDGLAATGSVQGEVEVLETARSRGGGLDRKRAAAAFGACARRSWAVRRERLRRRLPAVIAARLARPTRRRCAIRG